MFSILKNPKEDKYRMLKKSNKSIKEKLLEMTPPNKVL